MRTLLSSLLASSLLWTTPALAESKAKSTPARSVHPPAPGTPAQAAPSAMPAAGHPIAARAADTLRTKPTRDFPNALRSWDLENTKEVNVRLHEVLGTVPMHVHADTQERIFVIEGEVITTVGEDKLQMKPGDYVSIPAGVKHKVELSPGVKRALVAGFSIPPPDPKQTTWIEPAPKPAPAMK